MPPWNAASPRFPDGNHQDKHSPCYAKQSNSALRNCNSLINPRLVGEGPVIAVANQQARNAIANNTVSFVLQGTSPYKTVRRGTNSPCNECFRVLAHPTIADDEGKNILSTFPIHSSALDLSLLSMRLIYSLLV